MTAHTHGADIHRARVVFLIRVPSARTGEFLRAYQDIRHLVANGVPGHIADQVCQSGRDPEQWLITSEWESLEDFENWERDPAHRELVAPMRACFEDARSLRFHICAETRPGQSPRDELARPANEPVAG